MSKTENLLSIDKKSKKKLKLYNPEANENKEALEDIPFIATAFTDVIKYLLIYGALLIFTSFSLIYFIINSILFYILFSIMTFCELAEKIKKKFSHKKKNKINSSLRPIKRNSSNENFKKMKRMEKSQEYLGEKEFNLFFEIKNVFIFFLEKKTSSDCFEVKITNNKKEVKYWFKIRPCAKEFLKQTSNNFNLIVYTSLEKELTDQILELMEIDNLVQKKFYRDSCFENKLSKKDPSKDLSGILSRVDSVNNAIFLDYSANATIDIKHSTLLVKAWNGKKEDDDLKLCLECLDNFIEDPENKANIIESFQS